MEEPLYALSIRQPWIDLILRGDKTVEVRKWQIQRRGLFVLHAARAIDWKTAYLLGYDEPLKLPRGVLVGTAEIVEVIELTRDTWLRTVDEHRVVHPIGPGHFGAKLGNVRVFRRPIPCRGRPMFFPLPRDLEDRLAREIEAARPARSKG